MGSIFNLAERGDSYASRGELSEGALFVTALTLVLWVGCAVVGTLGLLLPYPKPRLSADPQRVVAAKIVNVEISTGAVLPPRQTDVAFRPIQAPPPPPLLDNLKPATTLPVAEALPAVAFALPVVSAAETTTTEAQPAKEQSASTTVTVSIPSEPKVLTFGEAEGRQPAPEYPRAAVRAGQEGVVRIGFAVGADGRVLEAEVVSPSRWPLLNEAALRAVRERWRFDRGTVRRYEVPIRFELRK